MSLRLDNTNTLWKQDGNGGFTLSVDLNYPVEAVQYKPGFWQTIKWGWLQYLAILVIFIYIFNSIKTFVFSNQILPTLVQNSEK